MSWNWQLPNWPNFEYDVSIIQDLEKKFLLSLGSSFAYLTTISKEDLNDFIVEILTTEGLESAKIEGEILDRESLQSSIKRHFGLDGKIERTKEKEHGMAELLTDVYKTFDLPLTHEMLWKWHAMLFPGSSSIKDRGKYRTHKEPMQIVSNHYDSPKVFFEAPPSETVFKEMTRYIQWFNKIDFSKSILASVSIAHLYFENIHPFEDGNGRIGRVLVEKLLSQGVGKALLIAVSKKLDNRKKEYYSSLEGCNRTLQAQQWVEFFSQIIVEAQKESLDLLFFLIEKAKMLHSLSDKLNPRQMKVLKRMFQEGLNGFKGGLSAENYIAITKSSRATATRDLVDLVEKKALRKTGDLKHTRYWLNLPFS